MIGGAQQTLRGSSSNLLILRSAVQGDCYGEAVCLFDSPLPSRITQYVNCHRRLMANHPLSDLDCCHLKNFGFDPAKQAAEDAQPKEMRGLGGA